MPANASYWVLLWPIFVAEWYSGSTGQPLGVVRLNCDLSKWVKPWVQFIAVVLGFTRFCFRWIRRYLLGENGLSQIKRTVSLSIAIPFLITFIKKIMLSTQWCFKIEFKPLCNLSSKNLGENCLCIPDASFNRYVLIQWLYLKTCDQLLFR